MWEVDSTIDFINDYFGKFPAIVMKKDFGADAQKSWRESTEALVTKLNAKLDKHKKKYICGERISTADFAICGIIFSHFYNLNHGAGTTLTDISLDVIRQNKAFEDYCLRMQKEL